MRQDSEARYHFKIHHCQGDNHYHFIIGPENISWPFWSRQAGRMLVDFSLGRVDWAYEEAGIAAGLDAQFHMVEFERLRSEIEALTMKTEDILVEEGNIAESWRRFFAGEESCIYYFSKALGVEMIFPLMCDFVRRDEVFSPRASRKEWARRALVPATPVTIDELGINLDPA